MEGKGRGSNRRRREGRKWKREGGGEGREKTGYDRMRKGMVGMRRIEERNAGKISEGQTLGRKSGGRGERDGMKEPVSCFMKLVWAKALVPKLFQLAIQFNMPY